MYTLRFPQSVSLETLQAATAPIQAAIGFTEVGEDRTYKAWLIEEDGLTDGDDRLYVGPIGWRAERLPFTFSDSEGDPHSLARHVGNLVNFRREMRGTESWVVADVDWDSDELAIEAKRLVDEGRITGVSVHPTEADGWMICGVPDNPTAESIRALAESQAELESCERPILAFTNVVIGAATLLMIPAFEDAEVVIAGAVPVASEDLTPAAWNNLAFTSQVDSNGQAWPDHQPVIWAKVVNPSVSSLATDIDQVLASAALDRPPAEWFNAPEPDQPTPLTVTDDGQVYGHLAVWDTCHTGFQGRCVTPPRDADYSYFQTARVIAADGQRIPVGPLVVDDGHAPASWTVEKVTRYYADTRLAAAYVTIQSGVHGPWASGAVSHKATPGQVETLRRHALSGDWRKLEGKTRLIAAVSVNGPGFVVPEVLTASGEEVGLVTYGPEPVVDAPSDLALVAMALTRLTDLIEAQKIREVESFVEPDPVVDELELEVEVGLLLDA